MPEQKFKRATAYKLRIGDLIKGKQVTSEENQDRLEYIELGDKQIRRVNIVANIVERFENEPTEDKTKYASLTLDDASGQIQARFFGDDVEKFKDIGQGDTVMLIGKLRIYQGQIYVLPEILKKKDPRYLLVRKLELEKQTPPEEKPNKEETKAVKDQIIELVKKEEENGGVESEKLNMEIDASQEIIDKEIQKLLEDGLIYEPRPGKIRYLG